MSARLIKLSIVSAEKSLVSENATMVVVRGGMGEVGIAFGHCPLLTVLAPGMVRVIRDNGKEHSFFVSGGVLEVQPSEVMILADSAMRAEDLDEARVAKASKLAKEQLAASKTKQDYATALAEIAAASAQMNMLKHLRDRSGRG
jgi:F-type H+-transporting ATPase subunit epsilon